MSHIFFYSFTISIWYPEAGTLSPTMTSLDPSAASGLQPVLNSRLWKGAFPGGPVVKNLPSKCRECGFNPRLGT